MTNFFFNYYYYYSCPLLLRGGLLQGARLGNKNIDLVIDHSGICWSGGGDSDDRVNQNYSSPLLPPISMTTTTTTTIDITTLLLLITTTTTTSMTATTTTPGLPIPPYLLVWGSQLSDRPFHEPFPQGPQMGTGRRRRRRRRRKGGDGGGKVWRR